ncbi:MAG TPA: tryptophan synthase subunit alpha [Methanosarcinaceae archaeon]|nr:tryptophan synthase subunit alpha [Methanosarcinaceae archaeon]
MNIPGKFSELQARGEGALIAYVCAGDPTPDATEGIVKALIRGGADIVELGLPFSDPVADGPTIQAASERALSAGMNTDRYFELVGSLDVKVPLVCMTYYNLIFKRGLENFVVDCTDAGISGIIVPDLPVEESKELAECCARNKVDLIFLIAPTTTEGRINMILEHGSGFMYLVSRVGVTGARSDIAESTSGLLSRVKTDIPKAVGFGISTGKQAQEVVVNGADAVIAGSVFVDIIASGYDVNARLEELAIELKDGILSAKR